MENEGKLQQVDNGIENEKKTYLGPDGKFTKGNPGGGRPKGSIGFKEQYKRALKHLAQLNNVSPMDLEIEMHANALKRARAGDFAFYRDTMDRVYGKPVQPTDITTGGQPFFTVPKEVAAKNAIKITDPDTLPPPKNEGEGNFERNNDGINPETVPNSQ